jgi:hypothetical protein
MIQYTNQEQTKHLLDLGFPHPLLYWITKAYSIGELISFLVNPTIEDLAEVYRVQYDGADKVFIETQLIDALYKACVDIKNKKLI